MKKKGELTTTQIIGIILLIVAFAILLYFMFMVNFKEGNEKQICQASVMQRASPLIPDEVVPLQCKTTYVCISADKGKCEKDLSAPTATYKIKTKEQTYQIIADEFADCWWMFGEGQVNYAGAEFIPKLYCSLCSQIVFDKSMNEIFPSGNFSQRDIYNYMTKIKISDNQTYSEYIYGTNDLNVISGELNFDQVNLNKRYYIGTGMSSEFGGAKVDLIGGTALTAISFIPIGKGVSLGAKALGKIMGVLRVSRTVTLAGGTAATEFALSPVVNSIIGQQMIAPFMVSLDDPAFEQLECKQLTTSS